MTESARITDAEIAAWSNLIEQADDEILTACNLPTTSPITLSNAARLRLRQLRQLGDAVTVPCDIHALGYGEPMDRRCTKIAGLPFRSRSKSWPCTPGGVPYTFVCQFDFRSSRDILPPVPEGFLLVFSETLPMKPHDPKNLYFEWQAEECDELATVSDCGGEVWEDFKGYARPYRSFEFQDTDAVARIMMDEFAANRVLLREDWYWRLAHAQRSSRFLGLKIGGLKSCTGVENPVYWGNTCLEEVRSLPYLCGFGSLFPKLDVPFPWLNRKDPLRQFTTEQDLNWHDGFQLSMFLNTDRQIRWIFEHY